MPVFTVELKAPPWWLSGYYDSYEVEYAWWASGYYESYEVTRHDWTPEEDAWFTREPQETGVLWVA